MTEITTTVTIDETLRVVRRIRACEGEAAAIALMASFARRIADGACNAAAPEMLAALRACEAMLTRAGWSANPQGSPEQQLLAECRDILRGVDG